MHTLHASRDAGSWSASGEGVAGRKRDCPTPDPARTLGSAPRLSASGVSHAHRLNKPSQPKPKEERRSHSPNRGWRDCPEKGTGVEVKGLDSLGPTRAKGEPKCPDGWHAHQL